MARQAGNKMDLVVALALVVALLFAGQPASARWLPSEQDRFGELMAASVGGGGSGASVGQEEATVQMRPQDFIANMNYLMSEYEPEISGRLKRLNPALPKPTLRFG